MQFIPHYIFSVGSLSLSLSSPSIYVFYSLSHMQSICLSIPSLPCTHTCTSEPGWSSMHHSLTYVCILSSLLQYSLAAWTSTHTYTLLHGLSATRTHTNTHIKLAQTHVYNYLQVVGKRERVCVHRFLSIGARAHGEGASAPLLRLCPTTNGKNEVIAPR